MPLVFVVLAIIVFFVVQNDKGKEQSRFYANKVRSSRRTNAVLEQQVLNKFMLDGHSFKEAYELTIEEMVKEGYDPCIPMNAYHNSDIIESSVVCKVEKYDSDFVRMRQERQAKQEGIGADTPVSSGKMFGCVNISDKTARMVEYERELKRSTLFHQTRFKIGDLLIYPLYGTCKVINIEYAASRTKGWYIVSPVADPNSTYRINITDSSIRSLINNDWSNCK